MLEKIRKNLIISNFLTSASGRNPEALGYLHIIRDMAVTPNKRRTDVLFRKNCQYFYWQSMIEARLSARYVRYSIIGIRLIYFVWMHWPVLTLPC